MIQNQRNKTSTNAPGAELANMAYNSAQKLVGIKVQKDGSLTRPDDIYDVQVADFIVEIDRSFLSTMSNSEVSDMLSKGIESCKKELESNGLKIMGSHMQSKPPEDEPHIKLSVLDDDRLRIVVGNMHKVTKG